MNFSKIINLILDLFSKRTVVEVQPTISKADNEIPTYVTEREYLMGRDLEYPLIAGSRLNMKHLLDRINRLRHLYGLPFVVSSGYRPGKYNKSAKGATLSSHLTCQAIDIADDDKALKTWLLKNTALLIELDLYMEHPDHTPNWVHLQTKPTKNRIFIP